MSAEAYPLQWPDGWERTKYRQKAIFNTSFAKARDAMFREIYLMGGSYVVLSSNLALRKDNLPYANQAQPEDTGIAVYFQYKDQQMVFACDRWTKTHDNVQAIRKTIEAIRGIERWGASDMMERAFTGFVRLASPDDHWTAVLGLRRDVAIEVVELSYRALANAYHPDKGGTDEQMQRLNRARDQAREELS